MEEIRVPQLGQSVEEASIVEWLKQEGDHVKKGDPLFTLQTDKAEIEHESPVDGVLRKILLEPDILAPVLTVAALIGGEDEPLPDLSQYDGADSAPAGEAAVAAAHDAPAAPAPGAGEVTRPTPPSTTPEETRRHKASPRARAQAARLGLAEQELEGVTGSGPAGRVLEEDVAAAGQPPTRVAPTAKRLAEMEGVDLRRVTGTGPGGRIMKEDVERAAAQAPAGAAVPTPAETGPAAQPSPDAARRTPLSPMRRIIAERMVESKTNAPHYYMTVEVDMAESARFREGGGAFKPSYNDFVLRAAARGLQAFPMVNARWAGDAIEESADINLGFAVALPTGLVVPVVKEAQRKSLQDIHRETRELTDKARNNRLTPDDYTGNTFTVSNLGALGVDHFTAIINQPDSAILAVGQIKDRPVVIDGGIHVRPIMKLTLSSDHRVIDGALAAQFLGYVKTVLENADY